MRFWVKDLRFFFFFFFEQEMIGFAVEEIQPTFCVMQKEKKK